jgi:endonuclease/exonuclease/phosphatase family metal-dependent hydrolase
MGAAGGSQLDTSGPSIRTARIARHAILVAFVCLAPAVSCAPGGAAPDGQPSPAAGEMAPTSHVLTHSPLARCTSDQAPTGGAAPTRLRVASWNMHAARSAPLEAIAAELQAMEVDIVALQEVDYRVRRTGFRDQPSELAAALNLHYAFAASVEWDEGDYGLAVLSRWPLAEVHRHRLDATEAWEPRIVLEVTVCAGGRPLRMFNHHADIRHVPRQRNLAELKAIVEPILGDGVVVLGDLNEGPTAPGVRALLEAGLVDVGAEDNVHTAAGGRIDYVLVDEPLARTMRSTQVWRTDKSDHHAVLADFDW